MNEKQAQWKALSASHKICEPGQNLKNRRRNTERNFKIWTTLDGCVFPIKQKWIEVAPDFGRKETLKAHNFPLPEICLSRCQNHIFVSLVNGTFADANCVNLNKSAYNNLNILPPTI